METVHKDIETQKVGKTVAKYCLSANYTASCI